MILLDTNILTRAAQPTHSLHLAAVDAVKAIRRLGYIPCIVPQVLYEFWVVATRPVDQNGLGMTAAEATADLEGIIHRFLLFRDERGILNRWQVLVTRHQVMGKNGHDARLVAAMQRHHISRLLTFNPRDFARFTTIEALTPDEVDRLPSRS